MKTFYERIYEKLKKVPRGKVTTYKLLAHSINSKAYRAVGNAMKVNKNPGDIPCYKVVNSNGLIGNYSAKGGTKEKIRLLEKDGIEINNSRIDKKYFYHFKK